MRAYQLPKGGAGSGPRGSHQLGKTPIWPFPTRIFCLSKQCLTTRLILIQKDRRKAVFFLQSKINKRDSSDGTYQLGKRIEQGMHKDGSV